MVEYYTGDIVTATASVNAGIGETITKYNWYLDGYLQVLNSNIFKIDTINLSAGNHKISLTVQNSCGEWSGSTIKYFDLITCPTPTVDFILS